MVEKDRIRRPLSDGNRSLSSKRIEGSSFPVWRGFVRDVAADLKMNGWERKWYKTNSGIRKQGAISPVSQGAPVSFPEEARGSRHERNRFSPDRRAKKRAVFVSGAWDTGGCLVSWLLEILPALYRERDERFPGVRIMHA